MKSLVALAILAFTVSALPIPVANPDWKRLPNRIRADIENTLPTTVGTGVSVGTNVGLLLQETLGGDSLDNPVRHGVIGAIGAGAGAMVGGVAGAAAGVLRGTASALVKEALNLPCTKDSPTAEIEYLGKPMAGGALGGATAISPRLGGGWGLRAGGGVLGALVGSAGGFFTAEQLYDKNTFPGRCDTRPSLWERRR